MNKNVTLRLNSKLSTDKPSDRSSSGPTDTATLHHDFISDDIMTKKKKIKKARKKGENPRFFHTKQGPRGQPCVLMIDGIVA